MTSLSAFPGVDRSEQRSIRMELRKNAAVSQEGQGLHRMDIGQQSISPMSEQGARSLELEHLQSTPAATNAAIGITPTSLPISAASLQQQSAFNLGSNVHFLNGCCSSHSADQDLGGSPLSSYSAGNKLTSQNDLGLVDNTLEMMGHQQEEYEGSTFPMSLLSPRSGENVMTQLYQKAQQVSSGEGHCGVVDGGYMVNSKIQTAHLYTKHESELMVGLIGGSRLLGGGTADDTFSVCGASALAGMLCSRSRADGNSSVHAVQSQGIVSADTAGVAVLQQDYVSPQVLGSFPQHLEFIQDSLLQDKLGDHDMVNGIVDFGQMCDSDASWKSQTETVLPLQPMVGSVIELSSLKKEEKSVGDGKPGIMREESQLLGQPMDDWILGSSELQKSIAGHISIDPSMIEFAQHDQHDSMEEGFSSFHVQSGEELWKLVEEEIERCGSKAPTEHKRVRSTREQRGRDKSSVGAKILPRKEKTRTATGSSTTSVKQEPSETTPVGPKGKTSPYVGVSKHRKSGRWEAHIWIGSYGRQVYLGGYDDAEAAAQAYDLVVLKIKGPEATTNFSNTKYKDQMAWLEETPLAELISHLRRRSIGFSRGTSDYRGVTRNPNGRWEARIGAHGRRHIYLGLYEHQEEAAKQYDRALVRLRGSCAATNFALSDYTNAMREHENLREALGRNTGLAAVSRNKSLKGKFEKWLKVGGDGLIREIKERQGSSDVYISGALKEIRTK